MRLTFSVNQYDNEGDLFDKCILIHINETTILRFDNIDEYEQFIEQMYKMKQEINETWQRLN